MSYGLHAALDISHQNEIAKSSEWYGQYNIFGMAYDATLSHPDDTEEFEP